MWKAAAWWFYASARWAKWRVKGQCWGLFWTSIMAKPTRLGWIFIATGVIWGKKVRVQSSPKIRIHTSVKLWAWGEQGVVSLSHWPEDWLYCNLTICQVSGTFDLLNSIDSPSCPNVALCQIMQISLRAFLRCFAHKIQVQITFDL